jgi:hypothetical protein
LHYQWHHALKNHLWASPPWQSHISNSVPFASVPLLISTHLLVPGFT